MGIFSRKKDRDEIYINEPDKDEDIVMFGSISHQEPSHALTPQEVLRGHKNAPRTPNSGSALDQLKKRMLEASENTKNPDIDEKQNPVNIQTEKSAESSENGGQSLLEKCKPFITDEDGKDASKNTPPLYKLESVAEILKSDSEKALERLSEKYNISFDELGNTDSAVQENTDSKPKAEKPKTEIKFENEVFEDEIKINDSLKNVQSSVPFVISDIDTPVETEYLKPQPDLSNTATITFTPIADNDSANSKIVVTQQTRPLDLTGELAEIEDIKSSQEERVELEKNEFEEFVPENECESKADIKALVRELSVKKRSCFIKCALSIVLSLVLGFMKLPFMTGVILSNTKISMIICAVITGIIVLLNLDMFKGFAKLFTKNADSDISASLSAVAVAIYTVYGIIKSEIVLEMLLVLCIILSFRALSKFLKSSYMLSNLKQAVSAREKNAVSLISDTAITFAMAKNAIEGDTLIAASKRCDHIGGYMKYSTFGTFLNGKINIITVLSAVLSLIVGFACSAYYDGAFDGLYAAAATFCLTAGPILFFIDTLPLYGAAKRLNPKKAMIAGKIGAEHIEMANALVLNSIDLFPEGTVTLHQMKVLSENSLDDTIIRAASLTESLKSPLAPIFKKIAGTSDITTPPDSDTVKYEDRMGISGWVDNRLLFIGNRTLMDAHGIEVPSVEIDRKILRRGYFPVYVATQEKACALLMIQYNVDPDISQELHKLSNRGVTLLVNNTDPNLTEEMICDYLGLYDDSVKVMSAAGCHMYRNAVQPEKNVAAPACFSGKSITLAAIMNCAARIKRSNTLLTVFYLLTAVLGVVIFAYSSFVVSGALISSSTVLIYSLITLVTAYILYLIQKP